MNCQSVKNSRILIAGSGNTTGINVIKALSGEYEIIGTDCKELNAANKFCTNFTVPFAASQAYEASMLDIIGRYNVTHVISTNDHDTRALLMMHDILAAKNVIHNGYCNNALLLLDKEETSSLFMKQGIDTPATLNKPEIPFVLRKKEMGNKAKFLYIIRNEADMETVSHEAFLSGVMTEYVAGPEFTVDVLCDADSNALCVVPRQRLDVRGGMVWHGKTVKDDVLIEEVKAICKKLRLRGIMCLQCIKRVDGRFSFIEINPRPGSGIDLSVNSGCNLPSLWVKLTNEDVASVPEPHWGMEMVRYNSAYFFHA